jgi:hypothetical protein
MGGDGQVRVGRFARVAIVPDPSPGAPADGGPEGEEAAIADAKSLRRGAALARDAELACDDPTESTEDRLARLAAALGPLRRLLAAIAERLIATKAHERLCYARLSDYAPSVADSRATARPSTVCSTVRCWRGACASPVRVAPTRSSSETAIAARFPAARRVAACTRGFSG